MWRQWTTRRWLLPGAFFLIAGLFFYDGTGRIVPGDAVRLTGSDERFLVVVAYEDGSYLLQAPGPTAATRVVRASQIVPTDN